MLALETLLVSCDDDDCTIGGDVDGVEEPAELVTGPTIADDDELILT